jgi:hypothetical protein
MQSKGGRDILQANLHCKPCIGSFGFIWVIWFGDLVNFGMLSVQLQAVVAEQARIEAEMQSGKVQIVHTFGR